MAVGIASTLFDFPLPEEFPDYYDPFIINDNGIVDLDLNGKARIRGELLRVDGRLRVLGNADIEGDLNVLGDLIVEGELIVQNVNVTQRILQLQGDINTLYSSLQS